VAGTAGGAPAVDHFASLWERIADAIPEAPAVVQGQVRRSWGELEARAALLAGALRASGLGEGSKVGLFLYNGAEYIEATFAAFKIRAVPVNVNYRYLDEELHYLLDNADAEAVVFHTSLGGGSLRCRSACHSSGCGWRWTTVLPSRVAPVRSASRTRRRWRQRRPRLGSSAQSTI
jgi:long-subunit acyl-CoA synthetase (AMP-forming)